MNNTSNVLALTCTDIDKLGELLAQIRDLTKQADAIKDAVKASGLDSVEGKLFRAVSIKQERTTYDVDVLKAAVSDVILGFAQRESVCQIVKVTAR